MSLPNKIKTILIKTTTGEIIFYKLRIIREKWWMRHSDEALISDLYRKRFGREINLVNPTTYTEKLQWMKLFYRNEKMPICSDKYRIREYLRECGLEQYANELLGVYKDAREIDFNALPNRFAAKANHGSSWNLICMDKSKLDWPKEIRIMNSWLKLNLYVFGREWNYKDIPPRIIVEKFIDHEPLNDYKFMCFNGEPLYMQLNNDYNGKHYVDFYKLSTWEHTPVTYRKYAVSDRLIEPPPAMDKMMELCRKLSKPFPFVRVDFYNFDDTIILGELTFFPGGGLLPVEPMDAKYDELWGSLLTLPACNHNQARYRELMEKDVH